MHTLSSARRTCIASASAVECTATVEIPSSRHARWIRRAISPRLAMRILLNTQLFQDDQRFTVLYRRAALHQDGGDRAGLRCLDLVECFHCFDQQQRLAGGDLLADADERWRAGL